VVGFFFGFFSWWVKIVSLGTKFGEIFDVWWEFRYVAVTGFPTVNFKTGDSPKTLSFVFHQWPIWHSEALTDAGDITALDVLTLQCLLTNDLPDVLLNPIAPR
jgi:hypothetical protein